MGRRKQGRNELPQAWRPHARCIPVFDDPYAITIADEESDVNERRFITVGLGATGRLLVVVYTWRGENIRIISARPAEPHEREDYEAKR